MFSRRSLDAIRDAYGEAEPHRTVRRQSRDRVVDFLCNDLEDLITNSDVEVVRGV